MDTQFEIEVAGLTPKESQMLASELATALRSAAPGVEVVRRKDSTETMDFGAILGIISASRAVTALARGIAAWLGKRQTAKIIINGISATGLTSADAVRIAELMTQPGVTLDAKKPSKRARGNVTKKVARKHRLKSRKKVRAKA